MEFEFDAKKDILNQHKHGIGFEEVQALWDDSNRIEIPAKTIDEPRWVVIGRIGGKHWAAIMTFRNDRVHLISVRRARPEEILLYESEKFG